MSYNGGFGCRNRGNAAVFAAAASLVALLAFLASGCGGGNTHIFPFAGV